MEQARALSVQRALAALILAAALVAAVVEHGSPLRARERAGKPWPFWLRVHEPGRPKVPLFHLGIYDPTRRSVVLIHLPEQTKLEGKLTLGRAYMDALRASDDDETAARAAEDLAQGRISALSLEPIDWTDAGRLSLERVGDDDQEYSAAALRALKARGRSPRAWVALAAEAGKGLIQGDKAPADRLFFALEMRRVPLERLEPAFLPDDASAPAFLGRVLAPSPPSEDEGRANVVEVLNGTDRQGLAAAAAKVLRSHGVDVISLGAASRPRSRTVVYDRTGVFARAARVRKALGCPAAIAVTRIDVLRGVDASVELGVDCMTY
jgi:hypothetical protein